MEQIIQGKCAYTEAIAAAIAEIPLNSKRARAGVLVAISRTHRVHIAKVRADIRAACRRRGRE